jgi:hypothetical protein
MAAMGEAMTRGFLRAAALAVALAAAGPMAAAPTV